MTKELGSTLAKSVRQAKAKQPQNRTPDQQQKLESSRSESELPLPSMPSRRVWPD